MQRRNYVMGGAATAAAFLTLSSAAWACTTFKGHAVLSGDRTGQSVADGKNSGMSYCKLTPGAQASKTGGSIASVVVTATTASSCAASNNVVNGSTYYLRYYNGSGFKKNLLGTYGWNVDCMEGSSGSRIGDTVNGYVANATGLNIANVTLPNGSINSTGQDSAVCLSTAGGGNGIQIPLHIIV